MTEIRQFGGLTCAEADDLAPAAALDALDAGDEAALRAHLAACPETHPAFATFALTAASLAELAEPVVPPPIVKTRLLAAVAEDLAGRDAAAVETTPAVDRPGRMWRPSTAPVDLDTERARRRPVLGWVLAAAAVIAIVALAGTSLFLQARLDTAEQLAVQLRDAIGAAGQPGAQVATVTGTDAQPGAGGFVVLPADGRDTWSSTAWRRWRPARSTRPGRSSAMRRRCRPASPRRPMAWPSSRSHPARPSRSWR